MRIPIKPLSVNECWQGRRFKTPAYKRYERDVGLLLKPLSIPEGPLELIVTWGLSNMGADVGNPEKPFTDILQAKYGFNDNRIHRMVLEKVRVSKGSEFIEFEIEGMT